MDREERIYECHLYSRMYVYNIYYWRIPPGIEILEEFLDRKTPFSFSLITGIRGSDPRRAENVARFALPLINWRRIR